MKKVTISEFRTHLYAILKRVQRTKRPVLVTRFGKPAVQIRPADPIASRNLFGFMKGEITIIGDIVVPASDPDDWEVLRD